MAYLETLQKHNADLQELIEKANTLPEKSDVAKELDSLIDGTITEVNSGVTNICDYAFRARSELTSVNFPNATVIGQYAFYSCSGLTSAYFPNATNINTGMFYECSSLASVDIPKATKISNQMFYSCKELSSANFPNATSIGDYAFNMCQRLESINIPSATSIGSNSFGSCHILISVDFPNVTKISSSAFYNCFALTSANFPKVTNIGTQAFNGSYSLKAVILRSETMCTLSNTNAFASCRHFLGTVDNIYNPNGDKDGYFYVPRALLSDDDATKDYRRATNWSTYATQFRALEDYTVDGTITGELDPNKI